MYHRANTGLFNTCTTQSVHLQQSLKKEMKSLFKKHKHLITMLEKLQISASGYTYKCFLMLLRILKNDFVSPLIFQNSYFNILDYMNICIAIKITIYYHFNCVSSTNTYFVLLHQYNVMRENKQSLLW